MNKYLFNRGFATALSLVLFAVAAIAAGVGTSQRMKSALLKQDALETARAWSVHVARVHELSGDGARDTSGSSVLAGSAGEFGYRLRDAHGEVIFDTTSEGDIAPVHRDVPALEASGWTRLLGGETLVRILRGTVGEPPPTHADVFVPIVQDGKPVGIVEFSIDQTLKAQRFDRVFGITALVTVALVIFGVGIPGGLLWHNAGVRREVEQRIDYLDQHDSLTGLVNRKTLIAHLAAMLRANDETHRVGVLSVGIDGFKRINDSLGHHVGDVLLTEISERLRGATRESDVVGRVTGDEFAVIAPGFQNAEAVLEFAAQLRMVATAALTAKGHFLSPSLSIGIAVSPHDGEDAALLIKRATVAQNWAKDEKQGSVRIFDKDMDAAVKHRFTLEMDMRRAFDAGQFHLLYQPQIDLCTGELVGCEALVRWDHPKLGPIEPDRFVPIAERTGLIRELGIWTLHQACADAAAWPRAIPVAVNLSPAQFANGDAECVVSAALEKSGLDPARLEVEITEGLIINDTQQALAILHKLRTLGVSVAMDDFGTGYSSLSYLTLFPYTKLKIDRSLLLRIEHDPNVASVIRSMVELGKSLDMQVVCEGVETLAQAVALAQAGCGLVQGYFFARPMSGDLLAMHLSDDAVAVKPEYRTDAA